MTAPDLYAVYGASGFGRDVMPLARRSLSEAGVSPSRLVFVDDAPSAHSVNGHAVMRYQEFLAMPARSRHAAVAIADGMVRRRLSEQLSLDGVKPMSLRGEPSLILDDVTLGSGAIICPFVTLASNVKIGIGFHANIYSYVEHDCVIGDYVTFAPAARCNGNVVVEDGAYVGCGALLKQGRPGKPLVIGRGAVVGMGAVVTRNVEAGITVVGNPARPMTRGN